MKKLIPILLLSMPLILLITKFILLYQANQIIFLDKYEIRSNILDNREYTLFLYDRNGLVKEKKIFIHHNENNLAHLLLNHWKEYFSFINEIKLPTIESVALGKTSIIISFNQNPYQYTKSSKQEAFFLQGLYKTLLQVIPQLKKIIILHNNELLKNCFLDLTVASAPFITECNPSQTIDLNKKYKFFITDIEDKSFMKDICLWTYYNDYECIVLVHTYESHEEIIDILIPPANKKTEIQPLMSYEKICDKHYQKNLRSAALFKNYFQKTYPELITHIYHLNHTRFIGLDFPAIIIEYGHTNNSNKEDFITKIKEIFTPKIDVMSITTI